MAIFGNVTIRQGDNIVVFRAGSKWDEFLNYLFSVLFICCLSIGVVLNPLILRYHSKQKKSLPTILFLFISSIDQIKSLYLPLLLIPKLLSSPNDQDYYVEINPVSVSWTPPVNNVVKHLHDIEMDLLVYLCAARYVSIKYPYFSSWKKIFASVVFVICSCAKTSTRIPLHLHKKPVMYYRVYDMVFTADEEFIDEVGMVFAYYGMILACIFLLVGGSFSGLTIIYLKNSDTASSESSVRNIEKSIRAILAMSVFNVFVMMTIVGQFCVQQYLNTDTLKFDPSNWTTGTDFAQFLHSYGMPLLQSAFNTVSFPLISSSFQAFVRELLHNWRVKSGKIQNDVSVADIRA